MNPYPTQPGFNLRVAHAERCLKLLAEGRDRRYHRPIDDWYSVASDRKMDDCFEMGDGSAVVWELTRRAQSDPVLRTGIAKMLGNAEAMERWAETAAYRGRQLTLGL